MRRRRTTLAARLVMLETMHSMELSLDNARAIYLRGAGWDHTSCSPDSVWRWRRMIDGIVYALSEADAFDLQAAMDAAREPARVSKETGGDR